MNQQNKEHILRRVNALEERLNSDLSEQDRLAGWNEDKAALWVKILQDTRAELMNASPSPDKVWMAHGVARQLDYLGISDGDLAGELAAIAGMIRATQ